MLELLLDSGSNKPPVNDYVLTQKSADEKITWTVPDGVTSICCVCVGHGSLGGGGLSWRNNIPVIPGESLYIHFRVWTTQFDGLTGLYRNSDGEDKPLCRAIAGRWAERNNTASFYVLGGNGGKSSNAVNDGGGSGGRGHRSGTGRYAGGGAGGYLGNGGDAASDTNTSTVGVAGSGSGSGGRSIATSIGGGVGLYGVGSTGANALIITPYSGKDGSPAEVICGGGGRGLTSNFNGGIRIIWGDDYSYPYNAI